MKGVLLAGGSGTRLAPMTDAVNKHLLPVYDKPLIYYSLAILMLAGIRDVMIVARPGDMEQFKRLIGDGARFGIAVSYQPQPEPKGIAHGLLLAEDFIAGGRSMLVLGDNIFFGPGLRAELNGPLRAAAGAHIFGYWVKNPQDLGVVELGADGSVLSLEEKPQNPRSHYAVPGVYFYDETAIERARRLKPSRRGELEITDLNRSYLESGALKAQRLQGGFAWLDTGTPDTMLEAASFIAAIERRQGLKIACLEEIAWHAGWLDDDALTKAAAHYPNSSYGSYLMGIVEAR